VLTSMMEHVVTQGTGRGARIPGVRVAGKTGTAETVRGAAPHAWFTGFAPADKPRIAVAVVLENGGVAGNETTGGKAAAPVAAAVMKTYLDAVGAH
jgi:peptidoglycan glycosyltransferase